MHLCVLYVRYVRIYMIAQLSYPRLAQKVSVYTEHESDFPGDDFVFWRVNKKEDQKRDASNKFLFSRSPFLSWGFFLGGFFQRTLFSPDSMLRAEDILTVQL